MRALTPLIAMTVACGAGLSQLTQADPLPPVFIHEHDAIRVIFQDELNARQNLPGDLFMAKVDGPGLLPPGTVLLGRVIGVHPATRRHAAAMEMQFTDVRLADGYQRKIIALPLYPNDKHLMRDANGRLVAKYDPRQGEGDVVGGAIGGFVIGSLVHRPIAGTVLGAFIGSIAAASERRQDEDLIVAKNAKMVAVFMRDVVVDESIKTPDADLPGRWHTTEAAGGATPPPIQAQSVDLRYDGKVLSFGASAAPYWDGSELMVPVDKAAEQFGLDVSHHSDGRLSVQSPDNRLDVKVGSTAYLLNDDGGDLRHEVVEREGIVYVPLEIFDAFRPGKIVLNGNTIHWKSS